MVFLLCYMFDVSLLKIFGILLWFFVRYKIFAQYFSSQIRRDQPVVTVGGVISLIMSMFCCCGCSELTVDCVSLRSSLKTGRLSLTGLLNANASNTHIHCANLLQPQAPDGLDSPFEGGAEVTSLPVPGCVHCSLLVTIGPVACLLPPGISCPSPGMQCRHLVIESDPDESSALPFHFNGSSPPAAAAVGSPDQFCTCLTRDLPRSILPVCRCF